MATSSRASSQRRGRKGGGSSKIAGGVVFAIVIGGVVLLAGGIYAITRTDTFAKIAGPEFRSTKPVFVTGQSVVQQQIEVKFKDDTTGKHVGGKSTVISELQPSRIAFSVEETELSIPALGNSAEQTIKISPNLVTIRTGSAEVQEILRGDMPPELVDTLEMLGSPIVSAAIDSGGFAPPVSEFSDLKRNKTAMGLAGVAAFVNAPFASNVDGWDAKRFWFTDSGEYYSGEIRFEKTSTEGDKVNVSVTGTMRSSGSMTFGNLTLATSTTEVSGEQVFSTEANQWVSGQLKLTIDGYAKGGAGQSGNLNVPFELWFLGTVLDDVELSEVASGRHTLSEADSEYGSKEKRLSYSKSNAPFYPSGPDWEIPIPPARPPVLASNYRPPRQASPQRLQSDQLLVTADRLKSQENYAQAEISYQVAITADPTNAMAMYQLACCYELRGQQEEALQSFLQAYDNGFNDFPTASSDSELGTIRQTEQFPAQLRKIRERYLKLAIDLVGTPLVTVPKAPRPIEGWPVIFLLHGYGDTNEGYLDLAEIWSDQGFVAVAMPGSIPRSAQGFTWSEESSEVTHRQIQLALNSLPLSARVNRQQVHLMGFSQGALHSFQAAKRFPELYRGVIALSPGGSPVEFGSADASKPPRRKSPLNVWFAYGKQEPLEPVIDLLEEICRIKGWKAKTTVHNGGHTFPENLMQLLPEMATFIKQ